MKKKELMDMLELKNNSDVSKKIISRINDLLYTFADDANIFIDWDDLKNEANESDYLNKLYQEIQIWLDNSIKEKVFKKRTRHIILISTMIFFITCAAFFTILDLCDIVTSNIHRKISIIFDGLGLITGIAFFIYERNDDLKK